MIRTSYDDPGDLLYARHTLKHALEAGLLINVTADTVIRLVPPLIYGAAEVDELVAAVSRIVKNYLQQAA